MSNLNQVLHNSGHASEIRQSQDDLWTKAGSGSPTTNWNAIALIEAESEKMLQQIEELVEKDPEGAAASDLGKIYMYKYGFLLDANSGYPYRFHCHDVILAGVYILAQLVAEEYFEDGPESTPFTPEAFLEFDFNLGKRKPKPWQDPFSTNERPRASLEWNGEIVSHDNLAPIPKPLEGFKDA